MTTRGERVLLLSFARREEEDAIRRAVNLLRAELPGAEITAVGTPVSAPMLSALSAERVIIYGGGRSARDAVEELRRCRPSLAFWGLARACPDCFSK